MNEQEVKEILRQYLKDKLTVYVDVEGPSSNDPEVAVTVAIYLGEEMIAEYTGCS